MSLILLLNNPVALRRGKKSIFAFVFAEVTPSQHQRTESPSAGKHVIPLRAQRKRT